MLSFDMNAGDHLDRRQKALPEGWRYKLIGYVALALGVIGAAIAWFGKGPALGNLNVGVGLPMLLTPYLIVPRVKTQRIWQGAVAGILSGIIALALLFIFDTAKYMPVLNGIGPFLIEYTIGSIATAWLSTLVAKWTDKYTTKRETESGNKHVREIAEQHKDRYRIDKDGNVVRVHKKKRKKR